MKHAKAKSSAPPASETRALAELPAWVKLISAGALADAHDSLHGLRRELAALLFYAHDATREDPEDSRESLAENILREGTCALMALNQLEDALWKASEQGRLPEMHWRDKHSTEGGAS